MLYRSALLSFVAALACGGCAGLLTNLEDGLRIATTDFAIAEHGLAAVCPVGVDSDICKAGRKLDETAGDALEIAVLAIKDGQDAQPLLNAAVTAVHDLVAAIHQLFAKGKVKAPTAALDIRGNPYVGGLELPKSGPVSRATTQPDETYAPVVMATYDNSANAAPELYTMDQVYGRGHSAD